MKARQVSEDDILAIVAGLLRMVRARELPTVWVGRFKVEIESPPGVRRSITWRQAERLVAGEPLAAVIERPRRQPEKAPNWKSWEPRRREYLREVGRAEAL